MQRRSSKMLVMLLTLAVFFSTVAATPGEKKSLSLIEARYVQGVGIVILFDSTGLTQNDIQGGTAYVHSNLHDMSCHFKDETDVVRCVISGGLSRYAGETFRVHLAGFVFWAKMPGPKAKSLDCSDEESLWYTVDFFYNGVFVIRGDLLAEDYEWLQAEISGDPEEYEGISIEIVDRYCGPLIIFEPTT